jgi:hypothetical protein
VRFQTPAAEPLRRFITQTSSPPLHVITVHLCGQVLAVGGPVPIGHRGFEIDLSVISRLSVYQLLHNSRMYPYMDWCVWRGSHGAGVETVIVNSDGAGYIPVGVFVPRAARMLFAHPGLSAEFRARWFSWAHPAETMLAYAELATKANPNVELWALRCPPTMAGRRCGPGRGASFRGLRSCVVADL